MRKVITIYDVLSDNEDGLTAVEISEKTGFTPNAVRNALRRNHFFYIDRWTVSETNLCWSAVWCLAAASEQHAPKPTTSAIKYWVSHVRRANEQEAA